MKSALSEACTIKIKEFEGPFDLLFYLFEKNKINIYDIPISEVTDQYMDYLSGMKKLDLDIASEFLLIAATLLHIKSKMLLPKEKKKEEKNDEIDPREDLVIKLIEYKKFKNIANVLKEKNFDWEKVFYKESENIEFKYEPIFYDMCPNELSNAYFKILNKNKKKENKGAKKIDQIIQIEKVSMKKTLKRVMRAIFEKTCISFKEIFNFKNDSKMEVITGFLSILELAKLKKLKIKQNSTFDDIKLYRNIDKLEDIYNGDEFINDEIDSYK
ncbi:MAG: segregation/condensation protein A [Clostridiales bacterium]